jgi:type II secretory pathway component PulK
MNRRGFALIAVLWVVTALTAAVGLSLAVTRLEQQVTINRVTLTRGRWAAEACLAIAAARWTQGRLQETTTVDLGRDTRCGWRVEDPTAGLNVNTTDLEVLRNLLSVVRSPLSVDSLLRARPFASLEQVGDSAVRPFLSIDGPATVNLSAAPSQVLLALPGMTPEVVDRLLARRTLGRPYTSLDALAADLSPSARAALLARYADLARITTFTAPQLVVAATGWVEGQRPRATIEVVVVPLPERLAVIRRRMW